MTYKELNNLKYLDKIITSKKNQLARLRRTYDTIKAQDYSKERITGGIRQDISDTVIKIVDLEREIIADIDALCGEKKRIDNYIKQFIQGEEYLVIQMYFFENMKLEEIAIKINRGYGTVKRFKKRALEKILKVEPQ